MSYKNCDLSDEEKLQIIKEFNDKIFPIFEEFSAKMPDTAIAAYLINLGRDIIGCIDNNYYLTLGIITDIVNDGYKKRFVEIEHIRKKEKNAPNTL